MDCFYRVIHYLTYPIINKSLVLDDCAIINDNKGVNILFLSTPCLLNVGADVFNAQIVFVTTVSLPSND